MQITTRRNAIAFFIVLCSTLVAIAIGLVIFWIIQWRGIASLVIGIVLFMLIIAGLILNTIFLVREILRNEQHDSFINAVTHELKTPIASIRLYLQTLQTREVTEAQRQNFYRIMHKDADRLSDTVEQVLRAAETVQASKRRDWSPVELVGLTRECIELARQRHQLETDAVNDAQLASPGAATTVLGDSNELRIALSNVLDNAVKYSPERVIIAVDVAPDGDAVQIRIRDQGLGIPANDLKHVFKRFFRSAHARQKVRGTGLGLFMVRSIIHKHRGKVRADSDGENKGTVITIRLPRLTT